MRFFKAHPALATLLVLAVIGLFAPVAYAIVDRVFLSIDTTKSEKEIEQDVKQQLDNAGHTGATVKATKTDHEYSIAIESDNPSLAGNLDMQLVGPEGKTIDLHLSLPETITEAQGQAVGEAASRGIARPNNETDAQVEKQITDELAQHGMKDTTVRVQGDNLSITVR